jgi:hypothetical protein
LEQELPLPHDLHARTFERVQRTTRPPFSLRHSLLAALSFRSDEWLSYDAHLETLDTVMAGLPLDGLVTLAAHNLTRDRFNQVRSTQHFWPHLFPKWLLLQRVLLGSPAARGFITMLLEDSGGRERPLLPSLTELVVVGFSLYALSTHPLCDALMKRVEQGVPVKVLDLRMCTSHPGDHTEIWLRSLGEIVVDVLRPEKTEAREHGSFVSLDDSSRSDTDSDGADG